MTALQPTLTRVAYDGATISANWSRQQGDPTFRFRIGLFVDGEKDPAEGEDAAGLQGTLTPKNKLTPDHLYTIKVAGIESDGGLGDWSTPVQVVLRAPTIQTIAYDGRGVQVTWVNPKGYPASGNSLYIYQDGARYAAGDLSGTSGSLPLDGPLPSGHTYTAKMSLTNGISISPTGDPITLITTSPVITEAVYTGQELQVSAAGQTGTLLLTLFAEGAPVQQGSQTGPQVKLTPSQRLVPWQSYAVTLAETQPKITGPASTPVPVLVAAPVLDRVRYDGHQLLVDWAPALGTLPAPTGAKLVLIQNGLPQPAIDIGGVQVATTLDLSGLDRYQVQLAASRGPSVGPLTDPPLALPTAAPAVTGVTYDGAQVAVTWSAASGLTGYQVGIYLGSSPVATQLADGGATGSSLAATLSPGAAYTVQVQPFVQTATARATGPVGTGRPVLTGAPTISAVSYDGTNLQVTWSKVEHPDVTGYRLFLYEGDSLKATYPVTGDPRTQPLPVALDEWKSYSVRVAATGDGLSGPLSAPVGVISARPVFDQVAYDGTQVQASWSPVPQAAVSGYELTLTPATDSQPLSTFLTSIAIAGALDQTKSYNLSVRAVGNGISVGPSSLPVSPFSTQPGYYFAAPAEKTAGYLYRSTARPPGPSDLKLYLPELFTARQTEKLPLAPFTLEPSGSEALPYILSMPKDSLAWEFSAQPIRADLRTAYIAFLRAVEAKGLKEGALAIIQKAIAQAMPSTFAESLYYQFGFDQAGGYINLQPGMRVRFDGEVRQFVNDTRNPYFSGFVPSGSFYAEMGTYLQKGRLLTGFNGFLARTQRPTVDPSQGGGAGLIDFANQGFLRRYYRLFYPASIINADVAGVPGAEHNMAVVGADSFDEMETITTARQNNKPFPPGTAVTWLRGRVVAIPEIQVSLNGNAVYVPVGTTLRQLVSAFTGLPFQAGARIGSVTFRRAVGSLVDQPAAVAAAYAFTRADEVYLGYQEIPVYPDGTDCFDLPLLQGDALSY